MSEFCRAITVSSWRRCLAVIIAATVALAAGVLPAHAADVTPFKTSGATAAVAAAGLIAGVTPTITGTANVGSTLTANPGIWAPSPVTLQYQWYRLGVAIYGTYAATYTPVKADAGKTLTVTVTGLKAGYTTLSKTSAPTAAVAVAGGSLFGAVPTITGTAEVGSVLTSSRGYGNFGPAPVLIRYQWYRSGVPVGSNLRTHTITGADAGKTLTVSITGSKPGYTTLTLTSAPTAVVPKGSLVPAVPTVTGITTVGSMLTAKPGTWGPGWVLLKYQWYRSGVAITGATAATRTLTGTDAGKTLTVRVTGTKLGYTTVSKTSAATAAVATGLLVTATPTIAGTAKVGSALTVDSGIWGPSPVTLGYQWYRSGVAITGSTAAIHILNSTDAGKTLTVRVTGTKLGYTTVTKTSTATKTVAK